MGLLSDLHVRIFADGADLPNIERLAADPLIAGFTTNPTLMRQAGVTDYEQFAHTAIELADGRPISFEVLSDDLDMMEAQARKIAGWGPNVNVKIPVTTTTGASTGRIIRNLADDGVSVNVTAVFTSTQVEQAIDVLVGGPSCYISVFAGRIADTGRDPIPIMAEAVDLAAWYPHIQLIWASPREVLNIVQADDLKVDVITITPALLGKLGVLGMPLAEFSLDTVRMFHDDAETAGYTI